MFHVLTGTDFEMIKKRVAALSKGAEVVRFGEAGEPFETALSRLGATGLFSKKVALLLDRPLESAEGKELITEHGKVLAAADTVVIALIPELDAATKKKLPAKTEIEEFEEKGKAEEPAPSVFALTDAFLKGDRKNSWVLYRTFIENGAAAEEIHGALSWQVRALVLASKTKSAEEAGLKPFVYSKAKGALSKFPNPDMISRELVALYHKARMGEGSLENLLESFLLKKV